MVKTATTRPSSSTELAVPPKAQLEAVYEAIVAGTEIEGLGKGDPEAMTRMILERIMAAETFEEAFAPQKLTAWRDRYLGVPVYVRDVHFNRSTIQRPKGEEGSSVYAVVDLEVAEGAGKGETATVTCGGRNVLVQILKALKHLAETGESWLERAVVLTSKPVERGHVLWLVSAEEAKAS